MGRTNEDVKSEAKNFGEYFDEGEFESKSTMELIDAFKLSNKINKQIKINLNNYNLSLKNMSVRHILNHHSNSSEVLRGQIPIKKTKRKMSSMKKRMKRITFCVGRKY